jgi:DNA-binding response OmpR family regulator
MVDQQARHPIKAASFVSRSIGRVQRALIPAQPSSLPVADGYELDIVARELRHDGIVVHLRPREFDLLATLAANPGRAFTRNQLIDLAWHLDGGIGPRAVDVHVHWLRSKIERRPAEPVHLVTVRSFGYRLDPAGPLTKP